MMNRENNKKELALYVHIPFCVKKCLYCDFLSFSAEDEIKKKYVDDLCREIISFGKMLRGEYSVRSIFFGGGTPTCLKSELLAYIIEKLYQAFKLGVDRNGQLINQDGDKVEFTVEANPGTITKEHSLLFRKMGVNRVSLGLQSAQDEELKCLGRIHNYQDFLQSYKMLRENGIKNINIDLMEDIPGQTLESYQDTLYKITNLKPEHISSYSLIVEPGTPFYEMQEEGKLHIADEDVDRKMYHYTKEWLKEQGYHRYEISNYALAGKECYHNKTYWNMTEYLGFGLGASSYFNGYRFCNKSDLQTYHVYCERLEQITSDHKANANSLKYYFESNHFYAEKEEVVVETEKTAMEEYMFLGLRMMKGISKKAFALRFGKTIEEVYGTRIFRLIEEKLLAEDENRATIYLTDYGIDLSNAVLTEFLDPDGM